MSTYIFKMPDIGEGIVDAEIVEWHVQPGEDVDEDALLAAVMTDKATVDITSPVSGRVRELGGAVGEKVAIGADLVTFETVSLSETGLADTAVLTPQVDSSALEVEGVEGVEDTSTLCEPDSGLETPLAASSDAKTETFTPPQGAPQESPAGSTIDNGIVAPGVATTGRNGRLQTPVATLADTVARQKKLASPAVRRRAAERGIDLASLSGSGPKGRILLADLTPGDQLSNQHLPAAVDTPGRSGHSANSTHATALAQQEVHEIPITGLRRIIARRMQAAKQTIPHFTYVEEVDVTELESLRKHLNDQRDATQPKLSPLHFIIRGVCRAVAGWPQCNAHYDADAEILSQFASVHAGVATMTDAGLMVPVIRNAHALSLWDTANEVNRLAHGARDQSLSREQLSGSTITISSLGPLAGVAATPILNAPETCIIGPNKIRDHLILQQGSVVKRQVMNLSSSFDHRVVDGFDAAGLIQKLKQLLEHPATLFLDPSD